MTSEYTPIAELENVGPLPHLLPSTHLLPADSRFSPRNLPERLNIPSDLSSSTATPTRIVRTRKFGRYCIIHLH